MIRSLRDEALLLLDGRGAILEVARRMSAILRDRAVDGAVIGGVAVVLHGHVGTTMDVELFVRNRGDTLKQDLLDTGLQFDATNKEFKLQDVPVHLVFADTIGSCPNHFIEVDGVQTVSLADLINMKLESGCRDPLRAQDLADVIGLIRCHGLTGDFAGRLGNPVRAEFRKLARAIHGKP